MKKIQLHIFLGIILFTFCVKAQNPGYDQLAAIVAEKMPATDLSDKIIAFQVWSVSDNQSRETNKELNRVGGIYKFAKLKNGNKGTVVISCNTDAKSIGDIAAKKDGLSNMIVINAADYTFLNGLPAGSNIVYDNTKSKIYENLPANKIFNSFNQLITR